MIRRPHLVLVAALTLAAAAPASASELGSAVAARVTGFAIHGADETLRDYCAWQDGTLYLLLPDGTRDELVTSTSDPAILNPGDGSFHPFDVAEVQSALQQVGFPLDGVSADVFVLPYPRRNGLDSAAGPGLILLAPGVRPLSVEHQHAEFDHELGHVVQYTLMPDRDGTAWDRYRSLRGIVDSTVYCASAAHGDRPHEIFAEDFRALFGDGAANYSGTIENATLVYPTLVPGLESFLAALGGSAERPSGLIASATVARGRVEFSSALPTSASLDVFDASGRLVVSVAPEASPTGTRWSWNGLDRTGRRAGATVLFARVRDASAAVTRFVLLP